MTSRGGGDPWTHGPGKPVTGPNSQGLPPKTTSIWDFLQPGIVW